MRILFMSMLHVVIAQWRWRTKTSLPTCSIFFVNMKTFCDNYSKKKTPFGAVLVMARSPRHAVSETLDNDDAFAELISGYSTNDCYFCWTSSLNKKYVKPSIFLCFSKINVPSFQLWSAYEKQVYKMYFLKTHSRFLLDILLCAA